MTRLMTRLRPSLPTLLLATFVGCGQAGTVTDPAGDGAPDPLAPIRVQQLVTLVRAIPDTVRGSHLVPQLVPLGDFHPEDSAAVAVRASGPLSVADSSGWWVLRATGAGRSVVLVEVDTGAVQVRAGADVAVDVVVAGGRP